MDVVARDLGIESIDGRLDGLMSQLPNFTVKGGSSVQLPTCSLRDAVMPPEVAAMYSFSSRGLFLNT